MSDFGEKLKAARLACGMKQEELASAIGSKTGNCISNWERGIARPDNVMLAKICTALHISADTLLGIRTEHFDVSPNEILKIKKYRSLDDHGQEIVDLILNNEYDRMESARSRKKSHPRLLRLPCYLEPVSAGTGSFLDTATPEEILVKDTPISEDADYVVTVTGDSMEPEFHDGDHVLVRSQETVDVGEIGIFVINGDAYIKKLGKGKLISLNEKYKPIPLRNDDSIHCCGKVLGVVEE